MTLEEIASRKVCEPYSWWKDLGATAAQRDEIRARIDAGQPVPTTFGDPLYPFGAGMTTF